MNNVEIRIVDEAHRRDINIPNEPFALFGRMIPSYVDEKWRYRTVLLLYGVAFHVSDGKWNSYVKNTQEKVYGLLIKSSYNT